MEWSRTNTPQITFIVRWQSYNTAECLLGVSFFYHGVQYVGRISNELISA